MPIVNNIYKPANEWYMSFHNNQKAFLHQWGLVVSAIWLGYIFSGLFSTYLLDKWGRKWSMVLACILYLIGGFLMALLYPTKLMSFLIVGRFITGIAYALSTNSAALWIGELAPLESRGLLTSLFTVFLCFGDLAGVLIPVPGLLGSQDLWITALFLGNIVAVLTLPVILFLPESPRFLYFQDGPSNKSIKSIEYYYGSANLNEVLQELETEEQAKISNLSLRHIIRDGRFRKTLILCVLLTGHKAILDYVLEFSTFMTEQAGLEYSIAVWTTVFIAVTEMVSSGAVSWLLSTCSRKSTILIALYTGGACNLGLTLIFAVFHTSSFTGITSVGVMAVHNVSYVILYGAVIAACLEICTQEIRATCLVSGRIVGALAIAVLSYVFMPLSATIGIWPITGLVALVTFALGLYVRKKLPETRSVRFHEAAAQIVANDEQRPLLGDI